MEPGEIKVTFTYSGEPKASIKCKRNEKLEKIFQKYTSDNNIALNKVYFLYGGNIIGEKNYDQSINEIIQGQDKEIEILVYNLNDDEPINIIFSFESNPYKIEEENLKRKVSDIIKSFYNKFRNKINKNIKNLEFIYRNEQLDPNKTLEDVIEIHDQNRKKMEIFVKTKSAIETQTNISHISSSSTAIIAESEAKAKPSFCKRNSKIIIILSIIAAVIIIFLILLFTIILKKKKDNKSEKIITENNNGEDTGNNSENVNTSDNKDNTSDIKVEDIPITNVERCLVFENTLSNYCLKCSEDFDLYHGACIPYAFHIEYDTSSENIQLFNPNKKNILRAIKINNEMIGPFSESSNVKNNKVYFYFNENTPISLSNMFENNKKLKYFFFNHKYIN